jgi:MFS transporter, UMF1 family
LSILLLVFGRRFILAGKNHRCLCSLYTCSISVALHVFTVISIGGIADRGELLLPTSISYIPILTPQNQASYRKPLLFGFAALGSFSSICFFLLASSSPISLLSALLAIIANIGFGSSIVVLNAYLPRLAVSSSPFSDHSDTEKLSRATARISSHGIALGYTAGILRLLVTVLPVQRAGGSTDALRFAIGGSGVWWALFSIPALLLLPGARGYEEAQNTDVTEEREGLLTSEPASDAVPAVTTESSLRREVVDAWRRLGNMLRWENIRRLRNTFRYLAAWFLLSDGT